MNVCQTVLIEIHEMSRLPSASQPPQTGASAGHPLLKTARPAEAVRTGKEVLRAPIFSFKSWFPENYLPTKHLFSILLFSMVCCPAWAQLVLDDQNIQKAKNATDVSHNCDEALMYLRLLSDSGKHRQEYFLTIAKANDCKANNEQAVFYYSKYLEKSPDNDSVKKRIAELKDTQAQKGKAAQQEQTAKAIYKYAKDGFGGPCLNERDFEWGLAIDLFTGGPLSPYREKYSLANVYQYPFAKNRWLFEMLSDVGYLSGGRKEWFAGLFNTTLSDVVSVPGTIGLGLAGSFSYMFINKHNIAFGAGPSVGFSAYIMPDVDMKATSNEYSHPVMFAPVVGLRGNVFFKKHYYCAAEYLFFLRSSFTNEVDQAVTTVTTVPMNGNSLRISVGRRGFGFPRYIHPN